MNPTRRIRQAAFNEARLANILTITKGKLAARIEANPEEPRFGSQTYGTIGKGDIAKPTEQAALTPDRVEDDNRRLESLQAAFLRAGEDYTIALGKADRVKPDDTLPEVRLCDGCQLPLPVGQRVRNGPDGRGPFDEPCYRAWKRAHDNREPYVQWQARRLADVAHAG